MGISTYNFSFGFISQYQSVLLKGFLTTLGLSLSAIILSNILAIGFGIVMSRKNKFIKYSSIFIVDVIRSIPLLIMLLICYYALPVFGDSAAIGQQYLSPDYVAGSLPLMHTPNVVTAVLADFRGFDTLIETAVVLTGALACLLILGKRDDSTV